MCNILHKLMNTVQHITKIIFVLLIICIKYSLYMSFIWKKYIYFFTDQSVASRIKKLNGYVALTISLDRN